MHFLDLRLRSNIALNPYQMALQMTVQESERYHNLRNSIVLLG